MKDSAAELLNASNVTFIVSDPKIPFFLIMSIAGLTQFQVANWMPKKQYPITKVNFDNLTNQKNHNPSLFYLFV